LYGRWLFLTANFPEYCQGIVRLAPAFRPRRPKSTGAKSTEKPGRSREGEDPEGTRLGNCSDFSTEEGLSTFAKWRIFVWLVTTFAVVELGNGLTVNNP